MNNMFKAQLNEPLPKSKEDCCQIDPVSHNLWEWAKRLENFGIFLTVAILIIGIYTCAESSYVPESSKYVYDESFSFKVFISLYAKQILYAVFCYLAHHSAALLVGGLASIVQNTRISARISQFNLLVASEDHEAETDDTRHETKLKKLDMWYCPECKRKNYYGGTCLCGYKPDESFSVSIDDEKTNTVCDCCKQLRNDVHTVSFTNKNNRTQVFLCETCIKKIYRE